MEYIGYTIVDIPVSNDGLHFTVIPIATRVKATWFVAGRKEANFVPFFDQCGVTEFLLPVEFVSFVK